MRFKAETAQGQPTLQELEEDYAQAQDLGKVRLGEGWIFFPKFSGISYLSYAQVVRAWLRQEEVKARLCCGTANFDQFYLVMECADDKRHRGQVLDKHLGQIGLDRIAERNPAVKIGYVKPQQGQEKR